MGAAGTGARLYGIPNCETVKKARAWLGDRGVPVEFVDFKQPGVALDALERWIAALGWEPLLNRKGTTWRRLDDVTRDAVTDAASAASLMRQQPSVIKRPVVEWADGGLTVGFDADDWAGRR